MQAVAEATRAAIQAMAVAGAERTQNAGPRVGRPVMKQPTFNWEAGDKYNELKNFRWEVNSIIKSYGMPQAKQIAIIKKLARQKSLQFLESLAQMEQERCNTMEGLFTTFNNEFKAQYNETMKPLQFCKLGRQMNENAEEWISRLRLAAIECNYRDR